MKYLALLGLLLILASCTSSASNGPKAATVTGTQGVVLEVIQSPTDVYENEQFPLVIEIRNEGAYGISEDNPGKFYLTYDPLYLTQDGFVTRFYRDNLRDTDFWLAPRTEFVPGESTYITNYMIANPIQRNSMQVRTPLRFSVCYPYQSNITTQVCLEQLRQTDPGAIVCRNQPVRPPTVGAPLGVELVEVRTQTVAIQDGGGIQPTFRITVKNYGQGTVAAGRCLDEDEDYYEDQLLNQIYMRAYLLNEPLDCGDELINLRQGEATVLCHLPGDSAITRGQDQGNFLSLLSVYLDYTYRQSITEEVLITR